MCSRLLQFYRRLEDAGEEITEEFLWGRLQPLLHYLPDDQVAKVLAALQPLHLHVWGGFNSRLLD